MIVLLLACTGAERDHRTDRPPSDDTGAAGDDTGAPDTDDSAHDTAPEELLSIDGDNTWFVKSQTDEFAAMMGSGASIAGDVDGDGLSDVLLGGTYEKGGGGYVYLFRAATMQPVTYNPNSDWRLAGPRDGYASAVHYERQHGATFLPDLDADGRSDVLVGASGLPGAYVVLASSLGETRELALADVASYVLTDPTRPDGDLGRFVNAGGDFDGDGVGELMIGDYGALWVVPGSVLTSPEVDVGGGLHVTAPDDDVAARFARDPVRAGDLDGDGLEDLFVDCLDCGGGAVFLFWGASLPTSGELDVGDADAAVLADGTNTYAFALTLLGATDLDGDGRDDWGAAALGERETGGVYLWFDAPSLTEPNHDPSESDVHLVETDGGGHLGVGSLAAGDFDGDGRPDVAVTDNWYDDHIYVLRNDDLPRSGTASVGVASTWYVPDDGDRWDLGCLRMDGDIDGDGLAELLYADPYWAPDGYGGWYGAGVIFRGH